MLTIDFKSDDGKHIRISKAPYRKRPALLIWNGTMWEVVGYFKSEEHASAFVRQLSDMAGIKENENGE